jgi:hypothetical protein
MVRNEDDQQFWDSEFRPKGYMSMRTSVEARTFGLWDIVNQFNAANFCIRVANLSVFEAQFQDCDPKNIEKWAQLCMNFYGQIIHAGKDCKSIGLEHAFEEIDRINSSLDLNRRDANAHVTAARQIRACLIAELGKQKFLYIDQRNCGYVDQDNLFGDAVSTAFPSAALDIREAGNCLAAECPTAAVFHLMRAAEYALRALAVDRGIKFPNKKTVLDLATWEDIIKELEKAEQAIQGYPKTLAREAQYDFYHGAMLEFKRFKNKFRNQIMHTRDDYDRDEAASAFGHVRDFMHILASRISEKTRTPMVWKGRKWLK